MLPRLRVLMSISAALAFTGVAEAVEMGNIEVQSAINEPFRAKIPLKKISYDLSRLSVSGASDSEYGSLGMIQNNVKLNYRLQDNGNGTGTLWIDSKQPVTEPFLDIVLNVTDNNQIQQHKVSALINPGSIKTLKRKKTTHQSSHNANKLIEGQEVVIQPINSAPPPLLSSPNSSVNLPAITQHTSNQNINDLISQNHSNNTTELENKNTHDLPPQVETEKNTLDTQESSNFHNKSTSAFPNFDDSIIDRIAAQSNALYTKKQEKPNKALTKKTKKQLAIKTSKPKRKVVTANKANRQNFSQYTVLKRDTLWGIANRVSRKKKIPLNQLMDEILASNPDAFIDNNPDKLKNGVKLTIPSFSASQTTVKRKKPTRKRKTTVTAKKTSKIKSSAQSKSQKSSHRKSKPLQTKSYKTNKSINDTRKPKSSEMRIVAKKGQGNAQGEASTALKKSKSKLPPQIISQIKQSRKTTIDKRKRINKLNTELHSFDHKLKLQNTKLAELEARLKKLQAKNSKK